MNLPGSNLFARATLGAIAAAAAIAAAPAPAAAQVTNIDGGGATLPSLLLRDLFNCYAIPPGGTAASPTPLRCSRRVTTAYSFRYDSVGSGAGQRGFYSQNPRLFASTSTLADVNFGVSDAALTATQVGQYTTGGRFSSTGPTDIADASDNCLSPATGNGADVAPAGGCYDNPRVENGPLIQIPLAGTAVAIAYDPVYKATRAAGVVTEYTYNVNPAFLRADGSGGLRLSRAALCGIFSGQITAWDDAALTAANGGTPLWPNPSDPDAATPGYSDGRQITVVHRDDDSGTTSLFTRAMRAQCAGAGQFDAAALPAGFNVRFPGSPAGSLGSGSTTCLSVSNTRFTSTNARWIAARGNEGVSGCVNTASPTNNTPAIGGRISYVSQDFALPYVNDQPYRGFALATADVQNFRGNYAAPTQAGTLRGLGSLTVPAATIAARGNPLNWVADPSGADPVVNPIADPRNPTAYPLVGTTNLLLYTCYDSQTKVNALARVAATGVAPGFLNWLYTGPAAVSNQFNRGGFTQLPATLRSAIIETFANPADTLGLNLYIRATPAGTLCTTGS